MPQVDDVIDAKEREEDRLLSLPGVTGVAIGLKRIGGKVTDEVVIHVYVERKLPEGELKPGDRIPPTIGGHKTDVIETGPIVEAKALQPGAQIASTWLLGTIACFVQGTVLRHDGERLLEEPLNGKRFLVTCAHVTNQENGCVYHPGLPHFGFTDLVATVSAEVYRGSVDAALCQLKDGWDFKNDIPEIGPIKGRLTRRLTKENVRSPYRVRKFGRTTEYTESTIDAVEALVKITESGRLLHSMLMISPTTSGEPFADAGDSGSPVVNDQGELVGIVQGVAPSKQSLVCQAADIFVQLAARMQLNSGLNPEDPRYSWVGLELAPFTQTALQSDPVIPDNLVPIYRHQSRGAPDRYSYNTDDKGDPEYRDGEEVFVAYDFGQPGTHKIYKHTAQDAHPKRYYYSTRLAGGMDGAPETSSSTPLHDHDILPSRSTCILRRVLTDPTPTTCTILCTGHTTDGARGRWLSGPTRRVHISL